MPIVRDFNLLPEEAKGGAVAIGNFDGVHRGHVRIVERLLERAREVGGPAVVFTFDPHPAYLLRPEQCPPPLTWTERKAELLVEQGVDKLVAYPTDERLLGLSAGEFFDEIVLRGLRAKAIVEGPNFYFGRGREGDVRLLGELATAAGISLDVVEPCELDGHLISSSRIRELVARGDVAEAARMLSAPYRIRGMVTHGAGRGGKIGFPTANLEAVDTLLPAMGVYTGRAWSAGSRRARECHAAAIHIGPNPTFDDHRPKVEVHLLEFDRPLYGMPLEVEFRQRLRGIERFDSEAALTEQLDRDIASAKELFESY